MDPQARLFQHLPLPGLFWPAAGEPGAALPHRAFKHTPCLGELPKLFRWPDGARVLRLGARGGERRCAFPAVLAAATGARGARARRPGDDEFVPLGPAPRTTDHLGSVQARFGRRMLGLGEGA